MKTQIRGPCDPKYDIAGDFHVLMDDSQIVNIDDHFFDDLWIWYIFFLWKDNQLID